MRNIDYTLEQQALAKRFTMWWNGRWISKWNGPFLQHMKHCLDFSFVYSVPLPAWRNLFSASGIFCGGRYQPGCTRIFWLVEGTCHYFLKVKKSQLCFRRKRTWVHALLWFSTCSQMTEGLVLRPFLLYLTFKPWIEWFLPFIWVTCLQSAHRLLMSAGGCWFTVAILIYNEEW
jgi:hypothetical protein